MAHLHAHNGFVRRWLFALLCCLTWAAFAQVAPEAPDAISRIAAADTPALTEAGVPEGAGGSDRQWLAASRIIVAGTDTSRKRSIAPAGVAPAALRDGYASTLTVPRPDRSGLNRSPHLRHVPLLI